jgi:oxalate decarboxylase
MGVDMGSKVFFSLASIQPQKSSKDGSCTEVTSDHVPGFVNISFSMLKLAKGGFQQPIWHPNAAKIGYCLQGSSLVTTRSPSSFETFTIKEGDVFFIPAGHIHQIANIGDKESEIAFALSHTKPQIMSLSNSVLSLSENVFSTTFSTQADFYKGLKKSQELIKHFEIKGKQPDSLASRYKFNVKESNMPIVTKGGYLQLATKTNLPVLDGLGILRFGLNPKGIVEPHWHTNAGELVFIVKGHTRISVLAPDGTLDTVEVKGGEGAFAAASHFHNIENIGNDEVEVIAFFSHAEPNYIGIGEALGSYSNEVLSSIFNVSPDYFNSLKKTTQPLVILPL